MNPMTASDLIRNKRCCGNGCMNCPYIPKHIKGSSDYHRIDTEAHSGAVVHKWGNKYGEFHRKDGPSFECDETNLYTWHINGHMYISYDNGNIYISDKTPLSLFLSFCKWRVNNGK